MISCWIYAFRVHSYNTRHSFGSRSYVAMNRVFIEDRLRKYAQMLAADGELSANSRKAYLCGMRRYLGWHLNRGTDQRQWRVVVADPRSLTEFAAAVESGEVRGGDGERLSAATLRQTLAAVNYYRRRVGAAQVPPSRCMTIGTPRRVPRALLGCDLFRWDNAVAALDYARESSPVSATRAFRDTAEFAVMRTDRDRAILAVIRYAGLRPAELESLDTNNVNLDRDKWLRVSSGSRQRQIRPTAPLTRALAAYLANRRLWPHSEKSALFLTAQGERYGLRSVGLLVADVAKSAGLTDVSPQTLRDTFATELTQLQAVPLREAARILGVRDVAALRKYRRLMHSHAHRIVDGIARAAAVLGYRPDPSPESGSLRISDLAREWETITDCARDHWALPAEGVFAVEQFLAALRIDGDELLFENRYAGWGANQYQRALAAEHALAQARTEIDRQWGTDNPGRAVRRRALEPRVQ